MTISLLIFLIITLLFPLIRFKSTSPHSHDIKSYPKIVGHRGAAGLAPENTLIAFQKAMEIGVDLIELDLHVSKDGNLVVIHDSNIERTTDGEGEIEDLSLEQIKTFDAGSWFGEDFKNESIPLFEEVLDLVDKKCMLLVELKWPKKGVYKRLVPKLIEVLKRKGYEEQVIIQSFERTYLEEIINSEPTITCHQLIFGKSSFLPIYFDTSIELRKFRPIKGVASINMFYAYANKTFIQKNEENNIQTGVFTVNKETDMMRTASLGVDYLITDHPEVAKQLFR